MSTPETTTPADHDLLRRFEPILRLADGERFLPAAVDAYVANSSLNLRGPDAVEVLVPEGDLTIDSLADAEGGRSGAFLRFVSDSERTAARDVRWRLRLDGPARLARVGLVGRIADALFRLSLVLRGTVPRGVAAGAARKADRIGLHDHPSYYARVVRDGGWTVLHYQFFYAMNDWRSAFGGANDHEADWEQVMVFCEETGSDVHPRWLAYATHDHHGDDLRRAWDDPEVTIENGHPVVFVGGGSHASYFRRGSYVTRIDIPALRVVMAIQRLFHRIARIPQEHGSLGIPFVDRAPGDGLTIGPGGDREWERRFLRPMPMWAAEYRGLWGLDTADFTGGERAPAGPQFDRDGTVRSAWADPVGYAGLQKVTPPGLESEVRALRLEELSARREELSNSFEEARRQLRAEVLIGNLAPSEIADAESELAQMRARESDLESEQRGLERAVSPRIDPRAHLEDPAVPEPAVPPTRRRLLNLWATLSAPLILGLIAAIFLVPTTTAVGIGLILVAAVALESLLRRRLLNFLWGSAVIGLVVFLVWVGLRNWQDVIGLTIAVFAFTVLVANVRELFTRR